MKIRRGAGIMDNERDANDLGGIVVTTLHDLFYLDGRVACRWDNPFSGIANIVSHFYGDQLISSDKDSQNE